MVKVDLAFPGMQVRGRCGKWVYQVRNGKQYAYPYQPKVRKTEVSDKEKAQRKRFGMVSSATSHLRKIYGLHCGAPQYTKILHQALGKVYDQMLSQGYQEFGWGDLIEQLKTEAGLKITDKGNENVVMEKLSKIIV
jgi:hypothetical protein